MDLQKGLKLTMEQQLKLETMKRQADGLSRDEAIQLLLEASRLIMIKDNVIREALKSI